MGIAVGNLVVERQQVAVEVCRHAQAIPTIASVQYEAERFQLADIFVAVRAAERGGNHVVDPGVVHLAAEAQAAAFEFESQFGCGNG